MNRRAFLKALGSAALLPVLPRRLLAGTNFLLRCPADAACPLRFTWNRRCPFDVACPLQLARERWRSADAGWPSEAARDGRDPDEAGRQTRSARTRRRPGDPGWPSESAWKRLDDAVGGNLIPVKFPLSLRENNPENAAAKFHSPGRVRAARAAPAQAGAFRVCFLPSLLKTNLGCAATKRHPPLSLLKSDSDGAAGRHHYPFSLVNTDSESAAAKHVWENLRNPYYIGEQPGLTQTLGWVDAWTTKPSVYAVAARNAHDIAEAVNFARENDLRLVVKGGGHSYQGTSNAPDSLLIWTRRMNEIAMHRGFVPQGCEHLLQPHPAVTLGAGTVWMAAYDAVTTKGGKYVQGGGCTTVGVAGLIQSGGFGSYSKHYGLAAGGLLEAEVVTADGKIRIANACTNSDLFWALKGGGGGSYGVVSKVTVQVHDLPAFFGVANFTIKAASDDAYRRLIREFVSFYREHLFNDHWGEQAHVKPDNTLVISMSSYELDTRQAKKVWQPFLDWVARSPQAYSIKGRLVIGSIPARHWWDVQWWKEHWPELAFPNPNGSRLTGLFDQVLGYLIPQPVFGIDTRPGAGPNNAWWAGDAGQVGWFIWGYESLWLPASLLESDAQQGLADALFASSRYSGVELHFNKGLAGATLDAIAGAQDTAMNPAVLRAFGLAIAAAGQGPAYPGIPGHEPAVVAGGKAAARVDRCMSQLRALVPNPGSYVSESNYFENGWQQSYWGSNYSRLAEIKRKYDPDGLFYVHHGVGSEQWSADGFTKL